MSISIFTIILFFIYSWGLGYTVTYFVKNSENVLERNLIRIGIGLGVFVVLGVLLNIFHIPLDWKVFLVLSAILPIINIARGKIKLPASSEILNKKNIWIFLTLIIFLASLFIYASGAFKYPYLEDDDPWVYALGTKYVAIEKTLNAPETGHIKFLDPYPPGYGLIMGVLHQTSSSLMWTLKFFNALIISLSMLMFFFFVKKFANSNRIALFATIMLATIPSYLTHFIWAHSLVIFLFFPSMYCLEKIKIDKKWAYVAAILIASLLLTHASQAIKLGIMLSIYFIIKSIYARRFLLAEFFTLLIGAIISLSWWISRAPGLINEKLIRASDVVGTNINTGGIATKFLKFIQVYSNPRSGSATRAYTFSDFFFAKTFGGINVTVGWGIVILLLLIIAIVLILLKYRELTKIDNAWITITLVWFIFTFLGVNAMTFNLPVGLFTFRFWLLLAIPVSLLAALGAERLIDAGKKIKLRPQIIIFIIIIGIILTAGYQKYSVNTAMWPPGAAWTSAEELQGYVWLTALPPNTKVFEYSTTDQFAIGFDKYSCSWCPEIAEFREDLLNKNVDYLHSFLKDNKYEYILFSGLSYTQLSVKFNDTAVKNQINKLLIDIPASSKFVIAHQTGGMVLFKVI